MNRQERANEIATNAPRRGESITIGNDVVRFERDVAVDSNNSVVLYITARRQNTALRIENPLIVVNPPVVVPDPSGEIELRDEMTGDTTRATVDGRRALEQILANFLEGF